MLDFRRLLYFCTIVEQGQISRAAKSLHISQPTLSQSLKELEDELGLTLIHREGGKWQVTERGQAFYTEAQRILTQVDDLAQNIRNPFARNAGFFGEVRVGCSGFCLSFLRAVLPRVEQEYPGIRIRLLVTDNMALENKVQSHGLDLAILHLPLMYGNSVSVPLPEQYFVAVWSPLLDAPEEDPVSLRTLAAFPLMLSRRWSNSGTFRPFIIAMQEENLRPRIILDTPAPYWMIDTLPALPAVAILHHTELPNQARSLAVRRINLPKLIFRPAIIWRKDGYLTPQSGKIIDLLCEEACVSRPR